MGTHPIFESDFDCLTELVTGSKSPWPTDLTQSRSSMAPVTFSVDLPLLSPSRPSTETRSLSSELRAWSSLVTSTETSSRFSNTSESDILPSLLEVPSTVELPPRCSSTSSEACSPTRPPAVRLPSILLRSLKASPPHTTSASASSSICLQADQAEAQPKVRFYRPTRRRNRLEVPDCRRDPRSQATGQGQGLLREEDGAREQAQGRQGSLRLQDQGY